MPVKNYNYCDTYPKITNKIITTVTATSTTTLSIPDQEFYMHLIYDIVHIGVSATSMKLSDCFNWIYIYF